MGLISLTIKIKTSKRINIPNVICAILFLNLTQRRYLNRSTLVAQQEAAGEGLNEARVFYEYWLFHTYFFTHDLININNTHSILQTINSLNLEFFSEYGQYLTVLMSLFILCVATISVVEWLSPVFLVSPSLRSRVRFLPDYVGSGCL